MGKYNTITEQIIDSIDYIVKERIKNASFDKTRTGKIVRALSNNRYIVKIDNSEYEVASISDEIFTPNSIVKVLVPENQYNNMFILAASSNLGGEIVSVVNSVNGKIGDVIIGISDINGLSEQLSNKLTINSNLKSNVVSFTESTIRNGISSGETLSSMLGKISKWYSDLSDVAFTGSYNDLVNKPSIPSKMSDITNDSNFVSDSNYVHTDNNYTTADKNKLNSLSNYTLPLASTTTLGGIKSGGDITVDSNGVVTVNNSNYTLPVATNNSLGGIKSGTDITIDTSGNVSVNNNSHTHTVSNISDLTVTTTELNYMDGVTSNVQSQLNGKSSTSHSHTYTTIPDTRSANELPSWYITNYPKRVVTEFKYCTSIGLSGQAYCKLTTYVPWSNNSGGYPVQEAVVGNRLYIRVGISDSEWGVWGSVYSTSDKPTVSDLGITATVDELNKLDGVTATTTELNYVDGVTSNIQTQLNAKAATSAVLTKTNTTAFSPSADYHPATKKYVDDQIIAAGNVYSVDVSVPTSLWVSDTKYSGYSHKAIVNVNGVTETNDIVVGLASSSTKEQIDSCSSVSVRCIEQGSGYIVLYSTGIPTTSFSISIIICN